MIFREMASHIRTRVKIQCTANCPLHPDCSSKAAVEHMTLIILIFVEPVSMQLVHEFASSTSPLSFFCGLLLPSFFLQRVSGNDAIATGATCPVTMTMPLSPLSSDEEQQRMLGNSQHLYPGAEDEEEEEEEEEEEDREEDDRDEEGEDEENGELEGEEEEEIDEEDGDGGGHSRRGRQSSNMTSRQPGDRQRRSSNPGIAPNPYSSNPGGSHQQPANQTQQQRRPRERSGSMVPSDDTQISMMVFRIGIPDIKQTVSLPFSLSAFWVGPQTQHTQW